MAKNKSLILILLVAAGIVTAAQAVSRGAVLHVSLAAVGVALGWYAGTLNHNGIQTDAQSIIDDLTGLHTYEYFVERLNEERKRADRFGSRVSMILVEIDDFKAVSDELGPQVGKDLIKQIAEVVKIQLRGVDIVSRYTEYQFGALLPNTGGVAAHEVAERVREAVEKTDFAAGKRTVSAGVVTYPDKAGDDVQLIERVEAALVDAKKQGENRVVVFGSGPAEKKAAT